jgi:adenylate cyclase
MSWLFGRSGRARAPVTVALLVLASVLALRVADPPVLDRLREFAFDGFQRMKPRVPPPDIPVRIVDIDEASLAEYGQWPWPRTVVAKLVEKLFEQGAAVVAFDVVFAELDRSSIGRVVNDLPLDERTLEMRRLATSFPDNDEIFAEAIRQGRVVTAFGFDIRGGASPPRRQSGVVHNSGEKDASAVPRMIEQFLPRQPGAVKTVGILEAAAAGNGSVTTDVEGSLVRRVPMLFRLGGQRSEDLYPALAIEALRVALGASTYLVRWASPQRGRTGVDSIRVGDALVETDVNGRVILYDSGYRPERFISARDVLKGTVPADKIDGHIVFIGTSAVGLKDLRSTPIQDTVAGVEIHAQIAEQVLSQTFLDRPDYADGAEFLYLAVTGFAFVLLMTRFRPVPMALAALLLVGCSVLLPWIAFDRARLLFDPIYPSASLALIYVAGLAVSFVRAERDRRYIRNAFNLYLSPDQVAAVVRDPEQLGLRGKQREITVMFTDVRGFTQISEQFDPTGLTRFMNRFLTPMTDLIQDHRGTIDKYMGDAIMAFWNAPLDVPQHARQAAEAALAMQRRLLELNQEWKAEAEAAGREHIRVVIGIGLNTGQATVGNFGSTQRLTYSCLGDEVNLASRLEGLCKIYRTGIVIGENTWREVEGFATVELDLVMVKGKTEPARIYALIGDEEMAKRREYRTLVEVQTAFLILYRTGSFAEAVSAIDECAAAAEAVGWQQGYYEMMRQRVDALIDDSPADWNGVHVATEK